MRWQLRQYLWGILRDQIISPPAQIQDCKLAQIDSIARDDSCLSFHHQPKSLHDRRRSREVVQRDYESHQCCYWTQHYGVSYFQRLSQLVQETCVEV